MLEQIMKYKYILIAILFLIAILIFVYLLIKKQKVKPIDMEKIEEEENKKTSIEEVLDAMESTTPERTMTTFEQEQEENAIISYQELVKAVNEKKANSEFKKNNVEKEDTSNESILDELIQVEEDIKDENEAEDIISNDILDEKPVVKEEKKFKNSEFISPVFGKDKNSNDDFLNELKDLRKNL